MIESDNVVAACSGFQDPIESSATLSVPFLLRGQCRASDAFPVVLAIGSQYYPWLSTVVSTLLIVEMEEAVCNARAIEGKTMPQ